MSSALSVTFVLPDWVSNGLVDGTFERAGGVIREVATKRVITWLRDFSPSALQPIS
jgi:hypothetical protein